MASPYGELTTKWDSDENRRFSLGVDRGMLFINGFGVGWSGLVSIDREAAEESLEKRYLDGRLYNVSVPIPDYTATLKAYTYPDEFESCIGSERPDNLGFIAHGQYSKPFSICYRTLLGDGNGYRKDYELHFVYDVMAEDLGHGHTTLNASPDTDLFSFRIHGIPVDIEGLRPSSYFSISSRGVSKEALEYLEAIIYGARGNTPLFQTAEEIRAIAGY